MKKPFVIVIINMKRKISRKKELFSRHPVRRQDAYPGF